jgi:hypothetical protein
VLRVQAEGRRNRAQIEQQMEQQTQELRRALAQAPTP